MRSKIILTLVAWLTLAISALPDCAPGTTTTIKGYVIDSSCAFKKSLSKPTDNNCEMRCARAGSPLVILADDGTIYWPIAATTPATGMNPRLLPYVAQRVTVTGTDYVRGGSHAIVIEAIGGTGTGNP